MKRIHWVIALTLCLGIGLTSCKEKTDTKEEVEGQLSSTDENATAAESLNYAVNTKTSKVMWKGSKPLGSHSGTINLYSGNFKMTNGNITSGKISINMHTITNTDLEAGNGKENLEAHLKGTVEGKEGDFFNVMEYPAANFEVTNVLEKGGATYLEGNLTIKDKVNPISFPITITPEGKSMTIKSEPFIIDRTNWGIHFMSKSIFDNLGENFISDDIEISFELKAIEY